MNSITTLFILYLTYVKALYTPSWVAEMKFPYYIYPQDIVFNSQDDMINIAFYKNIINSAEEGILFTTTDLNGNLQIKTKIIDYSGLTSASGIIDKNDNIFLLIKRVTNGIDYYTIRKFKEEDGVIIYDDSKSVPCCGKIYYLDDEYIYYTYYKTSSGYNKKAIIIKYDLDLNEVSDFEIGESANPGYGIKYHIKDMKIDYDGNLIVVGKRYNEYKTRTNNGNYWILKISNNNAEWFIIKNDGLNGVAATEDDEVKYVLIDYDNNIYLGGKTKNKLYSEGINLKGGWYNGFLAKYDINGYFIFW